MNSLEQSFEISRRVILGAGASLPAMSLPAIASPTAADPIFAAMRRHTDAEDAFGAVLHEQGELEETIPDAKRKTDFAGDGSGLKYAKSDDPRWVAYMEKYRDAQREVDARGDDLLEVKPSTVAGLVILLRYAYAWEAGGREWPGAYLSGGRSFLAKLCRHAADSTELLAARA